MRSAWRKVASGLILTLIASLALPMGSGTAGTVLDYPDFQEVTGLNLLGSATQVSDRLRLTNDVSQAGGVFSANQVDLSGGFSTAFSFQVSTPMGCTDSDGVQGADGIAFTLSPQNTSLGTNGGGLGYQGLSDTVGVEFDTWNNTWDESNGNHVGVNLDGNIDSAAQVSVTPAFNNGSVWHAWVDYDAAADLLEVRVAQTADKPATALLAYTVDIPAVVGSDTAYVGITSGTGCGANHHDLLSWTFADGAASCTPTSDLLFEAPLSTSSTGAILAGESLAIAFRYGDCTLDDSVTVRVRDAVTNQLIAGFTYGYQITYDPETGHYRQDFDTAKYGIGSGRTLKVMVYFGSKLKGTALVEVN
ncbi:MAG: lectin-like domain-containing protein [Bacillota bacterium]